MENPQGVSTEMIGGGADGGPAGPDGILSPSEVAEATIWGLRDNIFLILPHVKVQKYLLSKAQNYDRWITGMRKLRRQFAPPKLA